MEIYYQYQKLRRDFGRHPSLADSSTETIIESHPEESYFNEYVERSPCTTNIQIVPEMSTNVANTEQVVYKTTGMNHEEGGWPKEVDASEVEHTLRYRKKVEKDADYIRTVMSAGATVEQMIRQNNSVDIYEEYFQGQVIDHSSEQPDAAALTYFKDPSKISRPASYMSWYPDGARKLVVAYSLLEFQSGLNMNLSSYIWDVTVPNSPEAELIPHSPLCCTVYNPKDPNIIGGGMYSGQLGYWDTRKGKTPVEMSPIENSHRDPVYDMAWLQSKTGTECATISTDGSVHWWDTRRISEPVESLVLQEKGNDGNNPVLGGVSMEYEAVAGPTKFMVGTEQGIVLSCNRKAKTPADRVQGVYKGHHGPIYALERNPFFPKYFVSIGDWTARIWNEDLKTPILTTKYHSSYMTGGNWSPTRPGVFFTTRDDGVMDVWDFFYKQNDPVLNITVSKGCALTSFNIQREGRMVVCGAADGTTTLYELSEGLTVMQQNEKASIQQMFERESKREKNLETRQKELRQKARREQEHVASSNGGGVDSDGAISNELADASEEAIKKIEKEYFAAIKKESDQRDAREEEASGAKDGVGGAAATTNGDSDGTGGDGSNGVAVAEAAGANGDGEAVGSVEESGAGEEANGGDNVEAAAAPEGNGDGEGAVEEETGSAAAEKEKVAAEEEGEAKVEGEVEEAKAAGAEEEVKEEEKEEGPGGGEAGAEVGGEEYGEEQQPQQETTEEVEATPEAATEEEQALQAEAEAEAEAAA